MKLINAHKIVFGFLLAVICLSPLQAQFDAQFSQYMLHAAGFNPAATGRSGMLDVTGQHRIHWVGMPKGGSSTLFNINAPIKFAGREHGLGINFLNDEVGLFINQAVHAQYAFSLKVGKGKLRLGTQAGFLSIGFRGDSVRGPQNPIGEYHDISSDPAIPTSLTEGFGFDMGIGAWYTVGNAYAGISYSHLNQPVIEWTDTHDFRPAGTLYTTAGFSRTLQDPKYVLEPSVLFKTDFIAWQADLSMLIQYDRQFWGGMTYRWGDAVVLLAGLHIANGLSLGYSFDIPASQMIRASWGSHEVLLSYEFEVNLGGSERRKNYKSVRIL